jgi:hypothetical protein
MQLLNVSLQLSICVTQQLTIYKHDLAHLVVVIIKLIALQWCFNCIHTPTELHLVQIVGVATPVAAILNRDNL